MPAFFTDARLRRTVVADAADDGGMVTSSSASFVFFE